MQIKIEQSRNFLIFGLYFKKSPYIIQQHPGYKKVIQEFHGYLYDWVFFRIFCCANIFKT